MQCERCGSDDAECISWGVKLCSYCMAFETVNTKHGGAILTGGLLLPTAALTTFRKNVGMEHGALHIRLGI